MSVSTNGAPVTGSATGEVEQNLLHFLAQYTKRAWAPEEDLFASGAVSSLFALQLVMHLEQAFGIAIGGEHLTLDNFRTVAAMAALVGRLRRDEPRGSDEY